MILFVSGRCDIPAYYSEWFFKRIKEGFVDVRNPYNPHQISRIPLTDENIDALLFCTKNPLPMLPRLHEIPFPYIFQITLTPYKTDVERRVYDKSAILKGIKQMAKQIGSKRVMVRYDPIFLSDDYTIDYHHRAFEHLCEELEGSIETIIISFVDMYKNTRKNQRVMRMKEMTKEDMCMIAKGLGESAKKHHLSVQSCAEDIDLSKFGIEKGNCIDQTFFETYLGYPLNLKGQGVRKECNCLPTVDIGDYNCCAHECLYCYANYDAEQIRNRMKTHDSQSSVLLGHLSEKDKIVIREDKKTHQLSLL